MPARWFRLRTLLLHVAVSRLSDVPREGVASGQRETRRAALCVAPDLCFVQSELEGHLAIFSTF